MKFSDDQMQQLKGLMEEVVPPIVDRVLEVKLEEKLEPVRADIKEVRAELATVQTDVKELRKDTKFLKKEAKYLRETTNYLVEFFEEGDQKASKRVNRIEGVLGMTEAS